MPGTLTPISLGFRFGCAAMIESMRSRVAFIAAFGSCGVSKSLSSKISPPSVVSPTCVRRTPRLTPMKYPLLSANERNLAFLPDLRSIPCVSITTPDAVSGLTISVTVLLSIASRSAISVRVMG